MELPQFSRFCRVTGWLVGARAWRHLSTTGQSPNRNHQLVHTGSVIGDQSNSFWVQRLGAPIGTAAIRGDNSFGVVGKGLMGPTSVGLQGDCDAGIGIAVLGRNPGNAVQGISNGPAANSIGVTGVSDQGAGVQGDFNGIGVAGNSTQGVGGLFAGGEGELMAFRIRVSPWSAGRHRA